MAGGESGTGMGEYGGCEGGEGCLIGGWYDGGKAAGTAVAGGSVVTGIGE